MARLESIKQRLSKLEVSSEQKSISGEVKTFFQQSYDNLEEIAKCSDELKRNAMMVEELRVEESELNGIVKKNREEICKLMFSIKQLEHTLSVQKAQLNAKRKDHEYNIHELRQCVSIETSLAETMMEHLGMRLKLSSIDSENWQIQFIFAENKSVSMLYNVAEHSFDLQAIEPPHPAFSDAQEFLRGTEDISGFLYAIREYHFKENHKKVTPVMEQTNDTQKIIDLCDS